MKRRFAPLSAGTRKARSANENWKLVNIDTCRWKLCDVSSDPVKLEDLAVERHEVVPAFSSKSATFKYPHSLHFSELLIRPLGLLYLRHTVEEGCTWVQALFPSTKIKNFG
jgi:hypothetical protein